VRTALRGNIVLKSVNVYNLFGRDFRLHDLLRETVLAGICSFNQYLILNPCQVLRPLDKYLRPFDIKYSRPKNNFVAIVVFIIFIPFIYCAKCLIFHASAGWCCSSNKIKFFQIINSIKHLLSAMFF